MNNTIEHQVVDGTKLSIQYYSGKNRGTRKPEVGGNWLCTGGYTTDSLWCEKNAHGSWLNSMEKLGFRTGKYELDGVVNLYLWVQSSEVG